MQWIIAAGIWLDTAHLIAPILLCWTHPGYRRLAWARRGRSIWLPIGASGAGLLIGAVVPALFYALAMTYAVWNIYHFGSQNFGLAMLRRPVSVDGRVWRWVGAMGLTVPLMVTFPLWVGFSHWMTEIWVTWRTAPWRAFLPLVLLLGLLGLIPPLLGWRTLPAFLGARWGLGFAHFIYDGWMWKREVRIGVSDLRYVRPKAGEIDNQRQFVLVSDAQNGGLNPCEVVSSATTGMKL
jgi:hypothetical protein